MEVSIPAFNLIANYRKDPAAIMDYLGKHPDLAQKLVKETGLNIQKVEHYNALLAEARRNPQLAATVLAENLVSDCFGIDECKALAKAARSTRRLRLKFSTRTLRCLPSYRFEDNRAHAFEESTAETY